MRQVPEIPPFTFVYESRAHEQHAEQNEDTVLLDQRQGLAAIFDGMGSRKGSDVLGQIASQRAALVVHHGWERLLQQVQGKHGAPLPCDRLDLLAALRQLIQEAHKRVRTEGLRRTDVDSSSQSKLRSPKTTVALVSFCYRNDEGSYTMVSAHVGDSRIYLLREHEPLVRLTQDDGLLAILIQSQTISEMDALRIDQATDTSQLSETELDYFNKRYGVMQMLGDGQPPTIHVQQTPLLPGDRRTAEEQWKRGRCETSRGKCRAAFPSRQQNHHTSNVGRRECSRDHVSSLEIRRSSVRLWCHPYFFGSVNTRRQRRSVQRLCLSNPLI
jgi:PPM family protein phosphatase